MSLSGDEFDISLLDSLEIQSLCNHLIQARGLRLQKLSDLISQSLNPTSPPLTGY